ncbi:TorF family putative porin [Aquabacterium sp. J223]|uniref:TorF family putative porin n=1 Tax=Aquabacterium sp. J223 TaxID=2898431 RepID=UPI0021ADB770|nr:TorF family putative porin [Aquabacterium sp. J223]UUX96310.1 TorF family putative porin [Aquabacterium sp. J223]
MKKSMLALAALLAVSAAPSFAQSAPASDWTITGNAGLYSDYRFRGFSQTGYRPAFQGGFDVAHSSGFYVGNWNSNVEQGLYNGASLEMDFYGGYKGTAGPLGYDLGFIYYYYPNSGSGGTLKIKNGELYLGASYSVFSAKFYYATTEFFSIGKGVPGVDTKGSYYIDLNANFDLGSGWGAVAHYGYQKIKDGRAAGLIDDTVGDYKLGVTKDLSGWVVGASVIGTTEKNLFTTARSGFTEGAGKAKAVLSLSKTF